MPPASRILTASDHPRVIALWEMAGLHSKPKGRDTYEAFEAQLATGHQAAIGVEDEARELIGVVLPTHDGRKGWINRLAVHPDHRREGIALSLIEAAEAWLLEQGIEIYAALIEPDNDASLAVFEAADYVDWPDIHYVSKRIRPDI